MDGSSDVARQYTFSPPVDLLAILESLNIQYLDVNETRALVIFNTAVLNLESIERELTTLSDVEITVYELPRNTDTNGTEREAISVIGQFINQVTSSRETTASCHE